MSKKIEIEFPLESTRLEFSGMGRPLVLNPRECKGTHDGIDLRMWPSCSTRKPHECREQSPEISAVPLSRLIDESGDYAARWFAFWEEDCMDPPIYIVRAESFEQAYEDFCETRPEVKPEDLDEEQRTSLADMDSNGPEGYNHDASGRLVHTEAINGREITLVSATVLS